MKGWVICSTNPQISGHQSQALDISDPQSSFNAAVSPRLQRGLGPRPGRPWLAKVDSLRDAPVGESKWLGAEPPTMTLNDDLSIPSGKINYGK